MYIKNLIYVFALFILLPSTGWTQRKFIHPGITYSQGDLDRMKAMVEARQEPFYSTYLKLMSSSYSQIGNGNYTPITSIAEGQFNNTIGSDGRRAHDLALLYRLTGTRAYANDAVARLNRYNSLVNASSRGTAALDNGKLYLLLEAAELLRDYDGWKPEDQEAFKKMLVYPFYSTKTSAESYKSNTDTDNKVSFYWNIYQFDQGRFGNQGLFAARSLIALGVYLDNDTIYDRAYRYLQNLPSRTDDLPYQQGPPTQGQVTAQSDYEIDYNVTWPSGLSRPYEYHSDEVLKYYIYQNGQCQESSRDQGHVFAGLGNYTAIAEIAWTQGDSLYSCLDNRILKGLEYNIRYNLSYANQGKYPDQPDAWEPAGTSSVEADCTYDNGVYYQALSRSKRWKLLTINPDQRGGSITTTSSWRTQALNHYKIREGLAADKFLWLQRAYDDLIKQYGTEGWGVSPNWYYEWCGWGTLTKQRTAWMSGDPGVFINGQRVSGMPSAPCIIKAVDYDYYAEDGEGHTYHNAGKVKSTLYRTDGTVEITNDGDDYVVTDMVAGEWMSYSVVFPAPEGNTTAGLVKKYNIYATYKSAGAGVKLFAAVDNDDTRNGKELEPASTWTERCLGTFDVSCGAAVVRLYVKGVSNLLQLKSIRIEPIESAELKVVDLAAVASSIKVYDANNVDMTASYLGVIAAATDGDKNTHINLSQQKFLVYDFGEDGFDISDITLYNDGVIQDTREQAKVLGSTSEKKYTGAWDRNTASDILRTNGTTYAVIVPIISNLWVTTGGANGLYRVGPVGKYRYLGFYNWSTASNISELEIRSVISSATAVEDTELSAEWDNTDDTNTSLKAIAMDTPVKVIIEGNTVSVPGASTLAAYSFAGSLLKVSKSPQINLPIGVYILRIATDTQVINRKVIIK